MFRLNKISLQILYFFLAFGVFSCKKNQNHPVPSLPFDITIYINLPTYNSLESVGGWAYVDGGVRGLIVYRQSYDVFVAFDRQSPANDASCEFPLTTNKDNFLQLDDSCSTATFSLLDGSPNSGSDFGLRSYQTFWGGGSSLRIYN
jgi:hypothetical protein